MSTPLSEVNVRTWKLDACPFMQESAERGEFVTSRRPRGCVTRCKDKTG